MPDQALDLAPAAEMLLRGLFLVFGSLLGSFSNVVILRMAEGKSVVFPPSACPHCHHRLSPLDLIPVFGWILLRGQCRYCAAPISGQYPLIEAAAALTLFAAYCSAGISVRFIAQGGWGMISLIVAMLWLRGDVTRALPYLSPLGYRVLLVFLAGSRPGVEILEALLLALVGTAIFAIRNDKDRLVSFFGLGLVGLLGTAWLGWPYRLAYLLAAGLTVAFPLPTEKGFAKARAPLFIWVVAGMIAAAVAGNWGY
jgi:prepilin signal peptidase PulO-like enzyme (type II secretory pathway)